VIVGLKDKLGVNTGLLVLNSSHIYDLLIGPTWTRVRIPISQLGITAPTNLSRVNILEVSGEQKVLFIDQIRFTNKVGAEVNETLVTKAQVKLYRVVCTESENQMCMYLAFIIR
jgi:hypothetical protein